MSKLIETQTLTGDYNMPCQESIIELSDGRRVYLIQGFGGMTSLEGGQYRWKHGAAYQINADDMLYSVHEDGGEYHVTSYERLLNGYDDHRPMLPWSGSCIERLALLGG